MRRILLYLLLSVLSLCFSCGKAPRQEAPVPLRATAAWQKGQWDRCAQRMQQHLDASVRSREMRTLDAAFVAIMAAPESKEESSVIPFTTDGIPCEARILRSGKSVELSIFREGEGVGVFTLDEASFTGESTGIRFSADPFRADPAEVHATMVFSSEETVLVTLQADGPMEKVEVSLALPEGISLMGSVEVRRLWEAIRAISDAETREQVVPLVDEADAALHIGVYYEGDDSTPRARVSLRPLHRLSRYDDYWTWDFIIRTASGEVLDDAWNALGSIDGATATFVKAWRDLMPHILS